MTHSGGDGFSHKPLSSVVAATSQTLSTYIKYPLLALALALFLSLPPYHSQLNFLFYPITLNRYLFSLFTHNFRSKWRGTSKGLRIASFATASSTNQTSHSRDWDVTHARTSSIQSAFIAGSTHRKRVSALFASPYGSMSEGEKEMKQHSWAVRMFRISSWWLLDFLNLLLEKGRKRWNNTGGEILVKERYSITIKRRNQQRSFREQREIYFLIFVFQTSNNSPLSLSPWNIFHKNMFISHSPIHSPPLQLEELNVLCIFAVHLVLIKAEARQWRVDILTLLLVLLVLSQVAVQWRLDVGVMEVDV